MRYDLFNCILRAPEDESGAPPVWVDNPPPASDDSSEDNGLPPGAKPSDNPMEDYEKAVGESLWGSAGEPPKKKVIKIGEDEIVVDDDEPKIDESGAPKEKAPTNENTPKEDHAPPAKPQVKPLERSKRAAPAPAAPAPAPTPATPPAAPAPAPAPTAPQKPQVSEDLQEQHRLLSFAEKTDATKYKGLVSKLESYSKLREDKIKALMEADPDLTRDEILESLEFERWEKSAEKAGQKPVLSRQEAGRLRESMIVDDARRAVREEIEKQYIEPLRNQLNEIKTRPIVQQKMASAQADIWQHAVSDQNGGVLKEMDEAIKAAKKEGKSDADIGKMLESDYQMEHSAAIGILRDGWAKVQAFLDISHALVPVNPRDPTHNEVANMIAKYGQNIATNRTASEWLRKTNGAPAGATYLRSSEYYKLPESQRAAYFTLTNDNVVELMKAEVAAKAALAANQARNRRTEVVDAELRRLGLTRKDIEDLKKQKTNDNHHADPQPVAGQAKPKPKVSASPSGTPSKGGDPDVDAMLNLIDQTMS